MTEKNPVFRLPGSMIPSVGTSKLLRSPENSLMSATWPVILR